MPSGDGSGGVVPWSSASFWRLGGPSPCGSAPFGAAESIDEVGPPSVVGSLGTRAEAREPQKAQKPQNGEWVAAISTIPRLCFLWLLLCTAVHHSRSGSGSGARDAERRQSTLRAGHRLDGWARGAGCSLSLFSFCSNPSPAQRSPSPIRRVVVLRTREQRTTEGAETTEWGFMPIRLRQSPFCSFCVFCGCFSALATSTHYSSASKRSMSMGIGNSNPATSSHPRVL